MEPNVDCARAAMGVSDATQQNTNKTTRPKTRAEEENRDILLPFQVEFQIAIRRDADY
jgi:hypothetical protein